MVSIYVIILIVILSMIRSTSTEASYPKTKARRVFEKWKKHNDEAQQTRQYPFKENESRALKAYSKWLHEIKSGELGKISKKKTGRKNESSSAISPKEILTCEKHKNSDGYILERSPNTGKLFLDRKCNEGSVSSSDLVPARDTVDYPIIKIPDYLSSKEKLENFLQTIGKNSWIEFDLKRVNFKNPIDYFDPLNYSFFKAYLPLNEKSETCSEYHLNAVLFSQNSYEIQKIKDGGSIENLNNPFFAKRMNLYIFSSSNNFNLSLNLSDFSQSEIEFIGEFKNFSPLFDPKFSFSKEERGIVYLETRTNSIHLGRVVFRNEEFLVFLRIKIFDMRISSFSRQKFVINLSKKNYSFHIFFERVGKDQAGYGYSLSDSAKRKNQIFILMSLLESMKIK